jgi:hypothetical protein
LKKLAFVDGKIVYRDPSGLKMFFLGFLDFFGLSVKSWFEADREIFFD